MSQLWAANLWAPGLWATSLWEGGSVSGGVSGVESVVMLTQPSGAVTGAILTTQPIAKLVDENGNTVTSYTGRFKVILVGGTAQLIGDTVYGVLGIGTFTTLRLDGSGPQLIAIVAIDHPKTPGVIANVLNMAQPQGGSSFHRGRRAARGHR